MIRVMTERQLAEVLPPEQEYGYYIVEEGTEVDIVAGPFTDRYTAEHVAVTRHGMEPANGQAADEQDDLPW